MRARVAVATRAWTREEEQWYASVLGYIGKTRLCSGPLKKSGAFFKSTSSTGTTYPMKENPTRILSEKVTNGRRAHSAGRGRVRMDPLKKDEIVQPNTAFVHTCLGPGRSSSGDNRLKFDGTLDGRPSPSPVSRGSSVINGSVEAGTFFRATPRFGGGFDMISARGQFNSGCGPPSTIRELRRCC